MQYHKTLFLTLTAAMALLILAEDAGSMPVFARKYRTSCMTCHVAFPRRNAVGQAFRLNGLRFEDDETYLKEEPVELGDEAYERLWPKAVWPSDMPQNVPISFSTRFLLEADVDGTRKSDLLFMLPEEVEMVWAGTMGENISFYGDIIHLQKDFGGRKISGWTTIKAWMQFQNLLGGDNRLNLRLGTVGTQSLGLFTAQDANTFTTHLYQYSSWMLPTVDLQQAGLSEFEGNPFSIQPQMGFELNGHGARWAYAVGVVSGNLISPGNVAPEAPIAFSGAGKTVKTKDFYSQLTCKFGGAPLDGRNPDLSGAGGEEVSPLAAKADFWRDDSLILSAWGYLGTARIVTRDLADVRWEGEDDFWRAGVGFLQKYGDLDMGAGYTFGSDDNPYGDLSPKAVDSQAWFAEVLCFAYPWFMPYVRYEGMTLDLPGGVAGLQDDWTIQRVMPGFKALLRANISMTVELPFYFEGASLEEGFDRTLFMLMGVAF